MADIRVSRGHCVLDTVKLLFLVAEDSYFCTHRLNLGKAALQAGFKVAVATRCQQSADKIEKAGIQVYPLHKFSRGGLNPWSQCQALKELSTIYADFSPDVVHHVGMKPVVFGTLIARKQKTTRIINALGGLGYLFTESKRVQSAFSQFKKLFLRSTVAHILKWLHRKPNVFLILQNQDDIDTLINATHIDPQKIALIRGAGVDINAFPLMPLPTTLPITIACVSRMLWDKGIGELVAAATIIKQKNIDVRIILYGTPDPQNPASIDVQQLQAWHDAKIITWKGHCSDVVAAYTNCHIAVLPSYREGLPKSLLEAASLGRAIVTTDVPGCREIVEHGVNGLRVPAQDANALAEALITLSRDSTLQLKMGLAGRQLVESCFSDTLVHKQTIDLYSSGSDPNPAAQ